METKPIQVRILEEILSLYEKLCELSGDAPEVAENDTAYKLYELSTKNA